MNEYDVTTVQMESEKRLFAKPPKVNVISKEAYETRVQEVFQCLYHVLAKSFGPYGAPTIIHNYPYSHITKDGFTIMKNLSMDASEQLVDQSIANSVSDICGRLNYSVGDGTTSAVIATHSIYNRYIEDYRKSIEEKRIMPRNILAAFEGVKKKVIENLANYVTPIQSNNMDELYNNIYKVVFISSNGDEAISQMIANLYREIGYPGINSVLADGGETNCRLINGYQFEASMLDRLYINSDDDDLKIDGGADIIIFKTKITKAIYEEILKPLNEACRGRGRKLIVCATAYDETVLRQSIRLDLTTEFKTNQSVNMVLCAYTAITDFTKQCAEDFAMLCNTTIIDRELKDLIIERLDAGSNIHEIFNIDRREDIPNLYCAGIYDEEKRRMALYRNGHPEEMIFNNRYPVKPVEIRNDAIRLGYVGKCSIGLKTSVFSDFYYDQNMYNATIREAETSLRETEEKYSRLGTFNLAVSHAQQRYYALQLKMGVINISADGELSQKLIKDSVDDAIRAAESAFKYGVISGCNVDLIRAIDDSEDDIYDEDDCFDDSGDFVSMEDIQNNLINITTKIIRDGFCDVYRTVLMNAFEDIPLIQLNVDYEWNYDDVISKIMNYLHNRNVFKKLLVSGSDDEVKKEVFDATFGESVDEPIPLENIPYTKSLKHYIQDVINGFFICNGGIGKAGKSAITTPLNAIGGTLTYTGDRGNDLVGTMTLFDFIIEFSIYTGSVFDVSNREFTYDIINSMQTDVEILRATVDLISLLIAGNQMVVTQKHNF